MNVLPMKMYLSPYHPLEIMYHDDVVSYQHYIYSEENLRELHCLFICSH